MTGLGLLMALMVLVVGCAGMDKAMVSKEAGAPFERFDEQKSEMLAQEPMTLERDAERAKDSSSYYHPQAPTKLHQPQIIREASVHLKVDDLPDAMDHLETEVTEFQGMITHQFMSVADPHVNYREGRLTVRIPQKRLDDFLEAVSEVGRVLEQEISGRDVGAEIVDNEARVRNLRAEEKSLQQIMQRAGKIPEVLEASRELSRVRGEIERLESRVAYLKQQVAYSTVEIQLTETAVAVPSHSRPGIATVVKNTIKKSTNALYDLLLGIIKMTVWLVVFLLPILIVLALVVWGLWKILSGLLQRLWSHLTTKSRETRDPADD